MKCFGKNDTNSAHNTVKADSRSGLARSSSHRQAQALQSWLLGVSRVLRQPQGPSHGRNPPTELQLASGQESQLPSSAGTDDERCRPHKAVGEMAGPCPACTELPMRALLQVSLLVAHVPW
ncbi:hypothetical protein HJG60_011857 [Phyllostomus discolor]|uniref:Uncharacterized protein n=1 Tax=Phyllostomus discolor TaxID=89673 RepID=A0A834DWF0_9CHIR|nr:hypothetical protein HJG60_011857 [Phyllostomus discolor]